MITSSESASSIDTQFSAMIKEIKEKNKSIMVILDEKKCATMKNTIELIQLKLRAQFGMSGLTENQGPDDQEEEDNNEFGINEEQSSSDQSDSDAEEKM